MTDRKDPTAGPKAATTSTITSTTKLKVFENMVFTDLRDLFFDRHAVEKLRHESVPRFRRGTIWSINAQGIKRIEEDAREPFTQLVRDWRATSGSYAVILAAGIVSLQMQRVASAVDGERIKIVRAHPEWADEIKRLESLKR